MVVTLHYVRRRATGRVGPTVTSPRSACGHKGRNRQHPHQPQDAPKRYLHPDLDKNARHLCCFEPAPHPRRTFGRPRATSAGPYLIAKLASQLEALTGLRRSGVPGGRKLALESRSLPKNCCPKRTNTRKQNANG